MGKDRSKTLAGKFPAGVGVTAGVDLCTEAEPALLWLVGDDGARLALDADSRRAALRLLRERFAAGELDEVVFEAGVFVAQYPNRNYLRFRDEDLAAFALSFKGQPFLRDHNARELDARGGTIRDSRLEVSESVRPTIVQRIALTVPRDIEAFLNGVIDRFSISWHWTPPVCTVCGSEWMSRDCSHWPGVKYGAGEHGKSPGSSGAGGKRQVLCELLFIEPRGKEASAVNTPAVDGTGVRGVLSELMQLKVGLQQEEEEGRMDEQEGRAQAAAAPLEETPGRPLEGTRPQLEVAVALPQSTLPPAAGWDAQLAEVFSEAKTLVAQSSALLTAQRAAVLDAELAGSGLPAALQEVVRGSLPADWTVARLEAQIETQRTAWAKLEAERTVQGHDTPRDGRITGLVTGLDQLTEALGALMDGVRPRNARPLSGLREAYLLLSGDYEMTGKFRRDRVTLAAVDSTTMASIVADLLNKRVVNEFQKYPRWWEPICRQEDFATLQTIQWITLGGIGALPTVAEGAAYTELAWDDSKETATWAKKGGYVGITLEAMDKDDVGRLRSAPQALAQSAT